MPGELEALERLLKSVVIDIKTGCWLYQGPLDYKGYANIWVNGIRWKAHRFTYKVTFGAISNKKVLDHTCRTRRCINPYHGEPVTNKVNTLRGEGPSALNKKKTHCVNGHKFTRTNTRKSKGERVCRTCVNHRAKKYRRKGVINASASCGAHSGADKNDYQE